MQAFTKHAQSGNTVSWRLLPNEICSQLKRVYEESLLFSPCYAAFPVHSSCELYKQVGQGKEGDKQLRNDWKASGLGCVELEKLSWNVSSNARLPYPRYQIRC